MIKKVTERDGAVVINFTTSSGEAKVSFYGVGSRVQADWVWPHDTRIDTKVVGQDATSLLDVLRGLARGDA